MGCICATEYPVAYDADPPGEYDARWDRYRFAEISKGSDGHSDVEPKIKTTSLQRRWEALKYYFSLRARGMAATPARRQGIDTEPRRIDAVEDNDNNRLLSAIEKEKIRQWMLSIRDSEQEQQQMKEVSSSSFCRSRLSLNTIYTQDDVDLIRSASHVEGMADPMRLTDTACMSRLQGHLERQRRARRKVSHRSSQLSIENELYVLQLCDCLGGSQVLWGSPEDASPRATPQTTPTHSGILDEEQQTADRAGSPTFSDVDGSPRMRSGRQSASSWRNSQQASPQSGKTSRMRGSPSRGDLTPIREQFERLRHANSGTVVVASSDHLA